MKPPLTTSDSPTSWTPGGAPSRALAALVCGFALAGLGFSTTEGDTRSGEPIQLAQLVDLNRAAKSELALLPGVGPALSARIVAHRERLGPFESIDELEDVHGIGKRKVASLKPMARVSVVNEAPER